VYGENNNNVNNKLPSYYILKHLFLFLQLQWSGGAVLAKEEHSPLLEMCTTGKLYL
jgi:hypothetical protein